MSPPVDEDKSLVASDESCPAADNNLIHARIKKQQNKNNSVSLGFDQVTSRHGQNGYRLSSDNGFPRKIGKKRLAIFDGFHFLRKTRRASPGYHIDCNNIARQKPEMSKRVV